MQLFKSRLYVHEESAGAWPKFLNPHIRERVLAEAEVLYDCSPGRAHHHGNG
jgi:hypothetical protein